MADFSPGRSSDSKNTFFFASSSLKTPLLPQGRFFAIYNATVISYDLLHTPRKNKSSMLPKNEPL
jgi:hypothetical protein